MPIGGIDSLVRSVAAGTMTEHEAVMAASTDDVEAALHAQFDEVGQALATGLGVSPGAAVGRVYFDLDSCLDAADRGEQVILAAEETSPADEIAMRLAEGIVTAKGGTASHAAVVARGWGLPAVCGAASLRFASDGMHVGDVLVEAGETISINGATGEIFLGDLGADGGGGSESLDQLLRWADEVRGDRVRVRANVDTGPDASQARELGAQGIGLCRTEHMFLGDRLPLVQNVILAANDAEAEDALHELGEMQRSDFADLLRAMDGLPVTIRLLDPPLHEFLPAEVDLAVAEALGDFDENDRLLAHAARLWHEQNPMLGTRGVRLAIVRDGLYRMQVQALLDAAAQQSATGTRPEIGIMIPLISDVAELRLVRDWIESEIAAVSADVDVGELTVGTMIETPRAALTASAVAQHAEFFSFGTNDLTQLTWGFSRDDVETRVIGRYRELGLLDANPFERLDQMGVGMLVASAIEAGRNVNPDLEIGVCGEHGGEPSSIHFFVAAGVDYVSCSPFRVPVARLALAQAIGGSS